MSHGGPAGPTTSPATEGLAHTPSRRRRASSPAIDLNSFPDPDAGQRTSRPRIQLQDSTSAGAPHRRRYSYEEKGKAKLVADYESGSRGGAVDGTAPIGGFGDHGFVDNLAVASDWLSIRLPDYDLDVDRICPQEFAGLSTSDARLCQQEIGASLVYNPILGQGATRRSMDDMVYGPAIGEDHLMFDPMGAQEVEERSMNYIDNLRGIREDFVYSQVGTQEIVCGSVFDMVCQQAVGEQLMSDPVVYQSINSAGYQTHDEEHGMLRDLERHLMDDTVELDGVGEELVYNQFGVEEVEERMVNWAENWDVEYRRHVDRLRAMESAARFAHPQSWENHQENGIGTSPSSAEIDLPKLPDQFAATLKSIMERERLKKMGSSEMLIRWRPSKDRPVRSRLSPSLKDLSLQILSRNADEVESLEGIPDFLKKKFIRLACSYRKMSAHVLGIYLNGSPTEICLSDCSWAKEELFEQAFKGCDYEHLKVLQLDLCGRCLPDYVLHATFTRKPNSLPSLTAISLQAAYRLTDDGLSALASSAPLLSSVNLGQCSLLTSAGITNLAIKLNSTLRKLYIDDCLRVDVMTILPALMELKNLEVLSVARIESVTDTFVCKLVSSCGPNLRELAFTNCQNLTANSLVSIGESCSQLYALDIQDLCQLNDCALGHLANGCKSIRKLKLGSNSFSDEAVAAFLEEAGGSLADFSLNSVKQVAEHTAVALSRRCFSSLQSLDLSFCRKMTDEALGSIVDSCSKLRILKLFGCTQITDIFLDGHSNSFVKIVGLKGAILDQIDMPDFQ